MNKGGNQYKADPRQQLFLANYLDPKSKTFSNAMQSALAAGYAQEYSESLTAQMPAWLSENLGKRKLLVKAEKNLDTHLESKDERVNLDATKFTLKTLGKDDGYSERTEHTGKGGKDLYVLPPERKEEIKDALSEV